ncbi:MAG: NAD(P)-dependent oxidoreductase [Ginsengibacter sp.]
MKILVTGATGFVGRHVINELLKYEHTIVATTTNINEKDFSNKLSYAFLDIDNIDVSENYFSCFGNPDMLIHLAWQGLPNYKSLFHFEKNLISHYAFLKNIITNGLKKLVVTGTCFEYGMKDGCLSEDMVTDPQNSYALAKDTLRKFLFELKKTRDFDFKWIRLFYMYGEGQNPNALLSQLEIALQKSDKVFNMSGGQQERDYLPVEKVAEYLVKIALQNEITGVINCCSGTPIKVRTFVMNYLQQEQKHIQLNLGYYPYSDCEPMSFWGNNEKLKSIIDR